MRRIGRAHRRACARGAGGRRWRPGLGAQTKGLLASRLAFCLPASRGSRRAGPFLVGATGRDGATACRPLCVRRRARCRAGPAPAPTAAGTPMQVRKPVRRPREQTASPKPGGATACGGAGLIGARAPGVPMPASRGARQHGGTGRPWAIPEGGVAGRAAMVTIPAGRNGSAARPRDAAGAPRPNVSRAVHVRVRRPCRCRFDVR
eukprot:scaffold12360_cov109-Isochrysis_galbana.AAC.3